MAKQQRTTSTSFSSALIGDVTGTNRSNSVSSVRWSPAAINAATVLTMQQPMPTQTMQ